MTRRHQYSIFTHSVGSHMAGHSLISKIREIKNQGYDGFELFQDDLDTFTKSKEFEEINTHLMTPPESPVRSFNGLEGEDAVEANKVESSKSRMVYGAHGLVTLEDSKKELAAASYIGCLARELELEITCLQPLRDFEGWSDPTSRSSALSRATSRFPVMRALGTNLLMVCSNNQGSPLTTGDTACLAEDFRALGLAAKQYDEETLGSLAKTSTHNQDGNGIQPIRIAFEALAWGNHVNTWSKAWEVVELTNLDNVGLLIDTFNMLGREYANPCEESGINEPISATKESVSNSIESLSKIPGSRIFFIQIADAKKHFKVLEPSPNENESRPDRMIWSRSNRLYPCEYERGAYLPVTEVMKALVKNGYTGAWSLEVFNDTLNEKDGDVLRAHAERGIKGLERLEKEVYEGVEA